MKQPRGIFCIEGIWNHDDITDKSSILPILQLLRDRRNCDYVYHDCATREEFKYLLSGWSEVTRDFPILYLPFHGDKGCISLNKETDIYLEEISEILDGKCQRSIIYLGSCSTININGKEVQEFLKVTKASAVIGYKKDVEWIQATACELLVLDILQNEFFTDRGLNNIQEQFHKHLQNLAKNLKLELIKAAANTGYR